MSFTDFVEAWDFLRYHQIFYLKSAEELFPYEAEIKVARVNPATGEVEENPNLNIQVLVSFEPSRFWPELLSEEERQKGYRTFAPDPELNCDAPTFEEAVIRLANLVIEKHGPSTDQGES